VVFLTETGLELLGSPDQFALAIILLFAGPVLFSAGLYIQVVL
jgi:hypothetical protein